MWNFDYLLGIAEGPLPAAGAKSFLTISAQKEAPKAPRRCKNAQNFVPAAGLGAIGGARLPISCATLAARDGYG
jgi:hypothetical protein